MKINWLYVFIFLFFGSLYGKHEDCTFQISRESDDTWKCLCNDVILDTAKFGTDISFYKNSGYLTFNTGEWDNVSVISDSRVSIQTDCEVSCTTFSVFGSFGNFGSLYATTSIEWGGVYFYNQGNIFVGLENIEKGKSEYPLPQYSIKAEQFFFEKEVPFLFQKHIFFSDKEAAQSINFDEKEFNTSKNDDSNFPNEKSIFYGGTIISDTVFCDEVYWLNIEGLTIANTLMLNGSILSISEGNIICKAMDIDEFSFLDVNIERHPDYMELYHCDIIEMIPPKADINIEEVSDEINTQFDEEKINGRIIRHKKLASYLNEKEGIPNYLTYDNDLLIKVWKNFIDSIEIQNYDGEPYKDKALENCKNLLIQWFAESLEYPNDRGTVSLFLMCHEYLKAKNFTQLYFKFINDPRGQAFEKFPAVVLNAIVQDIDILTLDFDHNDMQVTMFSPQYTFVHELRHAIHEIFNLTLVSDCETEIPVIFIRPYYQNPLLKQLFCPFSDDLLTMCKKVLSPKCDVLSLKLFDDISDNIMAAQHVILHSVFDCSEELHNMYGIYHDNISDRIIFDDLNDITSRIERGLPIRWTHDLHAVPDIKTLLNIRIHTLDNIPSINKTIALELLNYNDEKIKNPFTNTQAYMPTKKAIDKLLEILRS